MKKMFRLSSAITAVALMVSPLSVAQAEGETVEATSVVLSTMPLTEVLNLNRAEFDETLGDYDIFTYLF
ncbi:MAG: hypothetical protein ACO3YZ_04820, partial [Candidatus Nanopelagicaceae bacterium]